MWYNRENVNMKWLRKSIDLRLTGMSLQSWRSEISNNRLCINYRIFKQDAGFETYLLNLCDSERITLSKFRSGNHRLPITENRYVDNNEAKLCPLCNSNDPGDEFHYTLVCPVLDSSRKKYINKYYYNRPNILKMNQLFNVTSQKQQSNLARFAKIIMSLF